jgi:type IV pilus assembly protein PilC
MLQAGVPLLQCFDALGRGQRNPRFARLLANIRADVETGAALSIALGRHAPYFSPLYCSLVAAGEAAGRLDLLLERLAVHLEKTEAMKSKLRAALTYPTAVVLVAFFRCAIARANPLGHADKRFFCPLVVVGLGPVGVRAVDFVAGMATKRCVAG